MKHELPKYCYRKRGGSGRVYIYFERGGGRERMPPFPSVEFWDRYNALLKGLPKKPSTHSWTSLLFLYRTSERYTSKKPRTKADYEKPMAWIERNWGDLDPRQTKRSQVIAVMRENSDAYRWANDFKTVVSQCMDVACDEDWVEVNRMKTIRALKPEKTLDRQPWPQDMIEAFRKEAPIGTRARLIFELCLGTGQRIGDVLSLRWTDCDAQGIHLLQGKTGAALFIPYTPTLREVLSGVQRNGITIASANLGRPLTYRQAQDSVMKVRKAIGAESYDIHGLRHTAAWELYEAGCSDEEVKAITGHSAVQMLRLYGGAARQKRHAKAAQEKRR